MHVGHGFRDPRRVKASCMVCRANLVRSREPLTFGNVDSPRPSRSGRFERSRSRHALAAGRRIPSRRRSLLQLRDEIRDTLGSVSCPAGRLGLNREDRERQCQGSHGPLSKAPFRVRSGGQRPVRRRSSHTHHGRSHGLAQNLCSLHQRGGQKAHRITVWHSVLALGALRALCHVFAAARVLPATSSSDIPPRPPSRLSGLNTSG